MTFNSIQSKIQDRNTAAQTVASWRAASAETKIVFTNGCFDILHYGHIHYLASAKDQGDKLIIGMNADNSIKQLKGPNRPINDALTRYHLMAALSFVDLVVPFEEETPLSLIQLLLPNVLVKGGDWAPTSIVGAQDVLQHGGQVFSLPFVEGYSTTNIETKIKNTVINE